MADAIYRSFIGAVQFDPREGKAGDKDVRNITIAATGVKEQALKVGATLWPSHAHVKVAKGDVVFVEGKFTRTKGENKEGETVTYSNLSVTRIAVLGKVDAGKKDAEATSSSAPADDADDDDEIPF